MPTKKAVQKQRSQHSISSDVENRQLVVSIQNGTDIFGTCSIETFPHEAPKSCEVFVQFCATGANTAEKNRAKQGVARTINFKRLSNIGIQFGEQGNPNPRQIPASDFESEIGSVSQGVGTISLCRSGEFVDGGNFFICMTSDPAELKHIAAHYSAFGRIAGGMDVLKAACMTLLDFAGTDGVVDVAACPLQISDISQS